MTFYAAPRSLDTRIFTCMPDRYRRCEASAWGAANRPGDAIDSFLEGPCFDAAGNLYVVDIPFGRIFRIDAAANWELACEYEGWPNGLKFSSTGALLIADYQHGLMELDVATGRIKSRLTHVNSERFKGVNDLTIAANGDVYFTDQGQTGMHDPSGRVYRLAPDGNVHRLIGNGPSPNGLAVDPAGRALYVAMTRAAQVWRIPLHLSGVVGKVGVFAQLPGSIAGPDGLAFDEAGNLYVAHAGVGSVWVIAPTGEPIARYHSAAGVMTTNIAFGGPDRSQIFITESQTGTILVADALRPGHAPKSGAGL